MKKLLSTLMLLALCGCPTDITDALRTYGYAPVQPASTMWQPGALVYIKSRKPFRVGYICTAEQVMGKDFQPMQSATNNTALDKATKKGLTLGANVEQIISADADLHDIKSVKMLLKNVRVFEVTDWQVQSSSQKADPDCVRAVLRRKRQGFEITMIQAAIQADITYSIQYDKLTKMDAQAKIAAASNLAVKMGVEASKTSADTIDATGLIWGIRDDSFLAYLFDPAHVDYVDRRSSRLIDPNDTPILAPTSPAATNVSDPMLMQQIPAVVEHPAEEEAVYSDEVWQPPQAPAAVPRRPALTPAHSDNRRSASF